MMSKIPMPIFGSLQGRPLMMTSFWERTCLTSFMFRARPIRSRSQIAIGIAFALCGPAAVLVTNFVVFFEICHESGAFRRFK